MKKWSTLKSCVFIAAFHRYITYLIPVSEWRATSNKKAREKQSEVQVELPQNFKYFTQCILDESISR